MRQSIKFFWLNCLALGLLFTQPGYAEQNDFIEQFIVDNNLSHVALGILLTDIKTGKTLYQRNADKLFQPASTSKLFTAMATLHALGGDYRFQTQAGLFKGPEKQTDLVIKFSGDPSLFSENLALIVKQATEGKKVITDVILDDSLFEMPRYPVGMEYNDRYWYFATPVTSINLDENKISVQVDSHKALGEKAVFTSANPLILVDGTVEIVSKAQADKHCQLVISMAADNHIRNRGCWPQKSNMSHLDYAINNPAHYAEQVIEKELAVSGIDFDGDFIYQKAPTQTQWLAHHHSWPVTQLVQKLLLESNNLYAESFSKTIGNKLYGKASFQEGANGIVATVKKALQVELKDNQYNDAAGFGHNFLTPENLQQLLAAALQDKRYGAALLQALPVSGVRGTLAERMPTLTGKVKAKTGSITGVSSLAGYILDEAGEPEKIIVLMSNNFLASDSEQKSKEDKLLALLLDRF